MDLIPIGEAAQRLGMRTSALRYYEERGLVRPATRARGRRVYGLAELRRLAFIQIAQRLGIGLDTVATVLDADSERRCETLAAQITHMEELIARAQAAKDFLGHALGCPAEYPIRDCPHLIRALDRVLDGTPAEQLAREGTNASRPADSDRAGPITAGGSRLRGVSDHGSR